MVVLRGTGKALRYLPKPEVVEEDSDTALGDWYVNRIVVKRKPLLVLISSRSYLPIVVPAQEVRTLPERLPVLVAGRLHRVRGVSRAWERAERAAMEPVRVAKTADRSVVGILVDYGRNVPYHVGIGPMDETVMHFVEERLQRTPWNTSKRASDVVFPVEKTIELLEARWGSG